MRNKSELNILYSCDDNYAPFCGTSMTSLFLNNNEIENMAVWVVDDGISETNKEKLLKTGKKYNRVVHFINSDKMKRFVQEAGMPRYHHSYATYYRFLAPRFLPDELERILYIDSDAIVTGSLKELITINLEDKCVGAVRDYLAGDLKTIRVGFDKDEDYFNAGVLLIDLAKWKERSYEEKIIHHIKYVRANYTLADQDLLNIILRQDKKIISPRYNLMPFNVMYSDKSYFKVFDGKYYSAEELEDARKHPAILHLFRVLGGQPWIKGIHHPYNKHFDKYMKKSEWSDYKKQKLPLKKRCVFFVESIVYIYCPKSIFLRFIYRLACKQARDVNQKLLNQEVENIWNW